MRKQVTKRQRAQRRRPPCGLLDIVTRRLVALYVPSSTGELCTNAQDSFPAGLGALKATPLATVVMSIQTEGSVEESRWRCLLDVCRPRAIEKWANSSRWMTVHAIAVRASVRVGNRAMLRADFLGRLVVAPWRCC
jgi:hypothetical protein